MQDVNEVQGPHLLVPGLQSMLRGKKHNRGDLREWKHARGSLQQHEGVLLLRYQSPQSRWGGCNLVLQ